MCKLFFEQSFIHGQSHSLRAHLPQALMLPTSAWPATNGMSSVVTGHFSPLEDVHMGFPHAQGRACWSSVRQEPRRCPGTLHNITPRLGGCALPTSKDDSLSVVVQNGPPKHSPRVQRSLSSHLADPNARDERCVDVVHPSRVPYPGWIHTNGFGRLGPCIAKGESTSLFQQENNCFR